MDTVWHPTRGKGVVLGKYKLSENKKNEVVDFDEREISVETDSELYKDALELAKKSGLGYSVLDFDTLWPDMEDAINREDIPDTSLLQDIEVPDVPEPYNELLDQDVPEPYKEIQVPEVPVPGMKIPEVPAIEVNMP